MPRLIDADALYNGTMKEEYFGFKARDEDGRESFAYSCAMQRLAEAPTIDAIPVEWLREKRVTHPTTDAEILHNSVIRAVLVMWEREQEAR